VKRVYALCTGRLIWSYIISSSGVLWKSGLMFLKPHLLCKAPWEFSRRMFGPSALILILWHIDPLLGKDLETNNETTAVAIQRRGKHASTTIVLLLETELCNPLLSSCNNCTTTMETGVFSSWSVPRSYVEDNWGDPVSCQLNVSL
jgi:hypothetical protein